MNVFEMFFAAYLAILFALLGYLVVTTLMGKNYDL